MLIINNRVKLDFYSIYLLNGSKLKYGNFLDFYSCENDIYCNVVEKDPDIICSTQKILCPRFAEFEIENIEDNKYILARVDDSYSNEIFHIELSNEEFDVACYDVEMIDS